jgi:hypothetical protein
MNIGSNPFVASAMRPFVVVIRGGKRTPRYRSQEIT